MGNARESTLKQSLTLPVKAIGIDVIAVLAITVLETIVMTALIKNYGVEISGETTEFSFKGSIKLQPGAKA